MLVNSSRRYGAFADGPAGSCSSLDWDAYCECQFASDPQNRLKCKEKPWSCCPVGICPPWASPNSDYGAGCRGIPRQGSGAAYTVGSAISTIDIASRLITPMQDKTIIQNEATVAKSQADQQHAALQRAEILKWAKYGAIAAGGVIALTVIVRVARPRKPAAPPQQTAVSSYRRRRAA